MLVANGNQYFYDDENRVVSATLILGGSVTYVYDAEGGGCARRRRAAG